MATATWKLENGRNAIEEESARTKKKKSGAHVDSCRQGGCIMAAAYIDLEDVRNLR